MAIAIFDTWLKKEPVQASSLSDNQKVFVESNRIYPIDRVLDKHGLHTQVELSYGAGRWWLFTPHWDFLEEEARDQPVRSTFRMTLSKTSRLIEGKLLFYRGGKSLLEVTASSGAPNFQYLGAESVRGRGMIPQSSTWQINTAGYWLNTRGIEGMFYHITPDPFRGKGFVRSELGLHRDANVPGSAGCIVVRDSRIFNESVVPFLADLSRIQRHVQLSVNYS